MDKGSTVVYTRISSMDRNVIRIQWSLLLFLTSAMLCGEFYKSEHTCASYIQAILITAVRGIAITPRGIFGLGERLGSYLA